MHYRFFLEAIIFLSLNQNRGALAHGRAVRQVCEIIIKGEAEKPVDVFGH
jgi:hypothetical protein